MPLLRTTLATLLLSASLAAAQAPDLVLAIGGEPETGFDPLMGWGGYGNPLFQSTLLKRAADLSTLPDLATAWSLSDDRLTWTLHLRDDVRFSDGSPLTAHDVAFTFNRAKQATGTLDLQVMQAAKALDAQTVEITLARPWITFTEAFYTLGIVPAASYGPDYGRNPIGSGPYQLVSWREGEQLIVEPNPYYYDKTAAFEQITFLFTGPDAGLAAAQAGVAHLIAVPAQMADTVPPDFRALPIKTVDNRGLSLPFGLPRQEDGRTIGNAVTADPAIRQAMNLGLDRDLLIDVALHGHATPAFGPADGLPWAGQTAATAYDLPAAKALLDAAGWREGRDGIRAKDGLRARFDLHYPASDPTRQALAETTAALLQPLGIEAHPKGGSWAAIKRVMHAEPVVFGFGSHSPYQIYSLYSSRLAGVEWANPSYYGHPETDALLEAAQGAASLEASVPLWAQATDRAGISGDHAWLWLANIDHVYHVHHCLELGQTQIEPHGHGWPITATLEHWRWSCE